jgi:hypothetical protein
LILLIGMINCCSSIFLLKIQKFYWGSVFISGLICTFYELKAENIITSNRRLRHRHHFVTNRRSRFLIPEIHQ